MRYGIPINKIQVILLVATVSIEFREEQVTKATLVEVKKEKEHRVIKQKYLLFNKIQINVKVLSNIPNCIEQSSP